MADVYIFTYYHFHNSKKEKSALLHSAEKNAKSKGLSTQGQGLKSKFQELTCKNGGRNMGTPTAGEPAVEPAPRAAEPIQAQDVAAAVRAPENGSVKEDVLDVSVYPLLPPLGDEMFIFP